jgi:hypothetical protein
MKKLLLILTIALSAMIGTAQDGLARWVDTDSVDTFISIYNSSADVRTGLVDILYESVLVKEEPRVGFYTFIVDQTMIQGEMFVCKGSTYNLYDFYVDLVRYPDGTIYRASRHAKPTCPWDYDKF